MERKIRSVALTVGISLVMVCTATIAAAQTAPSFQPVPASQVDQAQKNKGSQIATTTLNNWFSGKFEPLSDDFTAEMKAALLPEGQKQATAGIKALLGDFQSLEFAEAVASPSMPGIIVYRFRGKFSKEPAEVRVVLDKDGKVAGFFVKPWREKME